MRSLTVSLFTIAVVFGSAMAGMLLRTIGVIHLGAGLVGTMAALVLGLLVASAKSSYDAQSTELTQASANIILLDRVLAQYGPETKEIREGLRGVVARVLEVTWLQDRPASPQFGGTSTANEFIYSEIQSLSPASDLQRSLKSQALAITLNLGQTRWLMFEQGATSVSKPMLVIMVFWLGIIFLSWGLFAPPNPIVVATLLFAAVSVSSAIFLILEMYSPYTGLIQVSSAPLRAALAQIGQ
jgi:hypothetical protein